ncbi:MAG TPA: condensation domain-containing protein [Leptolyngbyaceae cyanobacterium]
MAQFLTDFPEIAFKGATWVDLLRYRALHQPLQRAFSFLGNGETASSSLSYGEFDRLARSIASQLQSLELAGERALLLYPPGLEYLAAFFGCLYAGVVAVPAYPPRNQRNAPRIQAIAKDAQAAIALSTSAVLPKIQGLLTEKGDFQDLKWLASDRVAVDDEFAWELPAIDPNSLAFLQYTSGSTGTPKGVMLTHGNLMHNAAMTYRMMEHSPDSTFVSWLPVYHDMGLIGGVLQPLYGGFPCMMMPPASFLQSPYSWLKAISDYGGTTSGGPNFAYELCVNKITPEQRASLNLSSWNVAFNGAEPIRHETLERFAATFAECGFRPEAFYPCYGMAETTLMVSGGVKGNLAIAKTVEVSALERNQIVENSNKDTEIRTFVSCGKTIPEQQIVIANPETLTRCLPNEIGEIWVSGPSVGQGYWNRQEETEQTFNAYLSDTKEGPFLRTGDLGFLQDGELFVTGRAKDLIIIRGRNLYPQDIEQIAERSHPSLRLSGSAAFAIEVENEERLVIVQELEFRQKPNIDEVISTIRQAVTEAFEIQVYGIVLIKAGSIPKTSSGKIQRRATRGKFLAGELDVVGSNILENVDEVENEIDLNRELLLAVSPEQRHSLIAAYLQQKIARILGMAAAKINLEQPPISLGIDSLKMFELKNQIEADFNVTISIEALFESASIVDLASQIVEEMTSPPTPLLQGEGSHTLPFPIPPAPLGWEGGSRGLGRFLPLSFAQQRLWFLDRLRPESAFYNIAIAAELKGQLNVAALKQSFDEIIRRHEVLRTNFINVSGTPNQTIARALNLPLPIVDLRHLPESERKTEAEKLALQEATQPFDLTQGSLLRVTLIQLGKIEYWMLLTIHHIVADGWSFGVLFRELSELYEAFSQGENSPLAELPIQYADYAIWQRQWLSEKVIESQLNYWQKQLENLPVLELPTNHPRPTVQTFQGVRLPVSLAKSLIEELKKLSQQQGVTLFMTLLATFQTLLYWYTKQTEIVVGTDIANRKPIETEQLIGFFVNQLVLRSDLSGNPTFEQLLQRVRQTALAAYDHSDIPFDKLVEELNPERNLNRTPLFQVKLVLQNTPIFTLELTGIKARVWEIDTQTAKYDLLLNLTETDAGLIGWLEYSTDLFEGTNISRLWADFEKLLTLVTVQSQERLSALTQRLSINNRESLKSTRLHKFQTVKRQSIESELVR